MRRRNPRCSSSEDERKRKYWEAIRSAKKQIYPNDDFSDDTSDSDFFNNYLKNQGSELSSTSEESWNDVSSWKTFQEKRKRDKKVRRSKIRGDPLEQKTDPESHVATVQGGEAKKKTDVEEVAKPVADSRRKKEFSEKAKEPAKEPAKAQKGGGKKVEETPRRELKTKTEYIAAAQPHTVAPGFPRSGAVTETKPRQKMISEAAPRVNKEGGLRVGQRKDADLPSKTTTLLKKSSQPNTKEEKKDVKKNVIHQTNKANSSVVVSCKEEKTARKEEKTARKEEKTGPTVAIKAAKGIKKETIGVAAPTRISVAKGPPEARRLGGAGDTKSGRPSKSSGVPIKPKLKFSEAAFKDAEKDIMEAEARFEKDSAFLKLMKSAVSRDPVLSQMPPPSFQMKEGFQAEMKDFVKSNIKKLNEGKTLRELVNENRQPLKNTWKVDQRRKNDDSTRYRPLND